MDNRAELLVHVIRTLLSARVEPAGDQQDHGHLPPHSFPPSGRSQRNRVWSKSSSTVPSSSTRSFPTLCAHNSGCATPSFWRVTTNFPNHSSDAPKPPAHFLSTVLDNNQSIGISWGRALDALCNAIKPADYYNVNVVQMVGCLGTGNPRVDGLELALRISKKLGGTYSNIYAPVYVDSELVYSYLVSDRRLKPRSKKH